MRDLIADVAKREWEGLGLQDVVNAVRNFTHGEHITFFRDAEEKNFYLYPTRVHGFDFIYMNRTASGKVVNELRVSKFRLLIRGDNPRNFFRSLDVVRKYMDDIVDLTFNVEDPTCPVNGDACSCKWFWHCKISVAHTS
ncbi:hypothetical protein CYMTET_14006 [Cymbomonas tetramitiformis]|uniref:Uncharacterized protein n=1 Tax=Cymbomonas tetramitiformis TaxID=36881 RepID=A0AAE0GIC8_9CHLO|nr:hypothetical protein CYMTET_14006 [Cymbomonas tetramitiformis]